LESFDIYDNDFGPDGFDTSSSEPQGEQLRRISPDLRQNKRQAALNA
jgi:hypothetical protein